MPSSVEGALPFKATTRVCLVKPNSFSKFCHETKAALFSLTILRVLDLASVISFFFLATGLDERELLAFELALTLASNSLIKYYDGWELRIALINHGHEVTQGRDRPKYQHSSTRQVENTSSTRVSYFRLPMHRHEEAVAEAQVEHRAGPQPMHLHCQARVGLVNPGHEEAVAEGHVEHRAGPEPMHLHCQARVGLVDRPASDP